MEADSSHAQSDQEVVMASGPNLWKEELDQQGYSSSSIKQVVDDLGAVGTTSRLQESGVQDLGSGVKASGFTTASDDEVDFNTSTGTVEIIPEFPSPTPTMLIHLTPEADRTPAKVAQYDSPSPSANRIRDLTSSAEREMLGQLRRDSLDSCRATPELTPDSSFDLISSPSDHEEYTSPARRTSFAPFTSHSSPVSPIRNTQNATRSSDQLLSGSSNQPPPARSRAYSGPMSRHPSTRPSSNSSSLLQVGVEKDFLGSYDLNRRRASHDGQFLRNRASLTGIALSPIPDTTDDNFEATESLNPTAKVFNLPPPALATLFGRVIKGGKTPLGDLTKGARLALYQLGLKPIPSMHGPLSLPYARCPSGIDAFLFSPERDDDPYTFILESDGRRPPRHSSQRVNPVPLPGNARYSLATQMRTGNRSVSAPSGIPSKKENLSKEINRRLRIFSSPAETRPRGVREVLAQEGLEGYQIQYNDIVGRENSGYYSEHRREAEEGARYSYDNPNYSEGGLDTESFGGPPTILASPSYPPPHSYYSYPWSGYGPPYYPAYHHAPQPFYPPHPYPHMPSSVPVTYQDPAIVSYVYRGNNAEADESTETSYHTANEEDSLADSEDEEPQLAGFFFPAVPSPTRQQYRRDSLSSATTTVPRYFNRKPSMAVSGSLASLIAERRNSSAPNLPHIQRRKSIAPPVTVSASRRSSAVGQPQIFEAKAVRQPRNPPSIPSNQTISQPAVTKTSTPHNLVPHRSRPQIATDVSSVKAAIHSPARTIQSPLSRTALANISANSVAEPAPPRNNRRGSSTGFKQSGEPLGKGGEANWRAHGAKLSGVGDPSIEKKTIDSENHTSPEVKASAESKASGENSTRHFGRHKGRARKGKTVKTEV